MKVLMVNTSDIRGGAARAAYRLHRGLLEAGIDSQMLVQSKDSDDFTVVKPQTKLQKAAAKFRPFLDSVPTKFYKNRTQTPFSPAWLPWGGMAKKINTLNPDIVHLHWICGGMMNINQLAKIKSPIVWSLHDLWAFTGGCHYSGDCLAYKNMCGCCEVLGSVKSADLSRRVFFQKKKCFDAIESLTIIGLSQWLAQCAKESLLFKNKPVVNLPNPLDTRTFSPVDKTTAKQILNLPQDKKLILFGAMAATGDKRKGFRQLLEAIDKLNRDDVELVVFGSSEPKEPVEFKFEVHYLGHLHDDLSLRVLYSAADVMVVPSLQENLSNTIMESMACGTPVTAFEIGGNSDMIDHQQNGYLATPFSPANLAKGINWILDHPLPDGLRQNARQKILDCFDTDVVVRKYRMLYQEILANHGRK